MIQPLRATSATAVRMIRWVVCSGLMVVCIASVLARIWPVRGSGGKESIAASATGPLPPAAQNQIGRLTSMGNGLRRTAYEYDELGRATRTVHNFEAQSKAFTTAYGLPQSGVPASGLGTVPVSQTFPDNERVDYTYDGGGAQQSIKTTPPNGPQQTIINSILRNSRGQTIAATFGNGAISIYKYNEATNLRLDQIQTAIGATLTITAGVPQLTGGTTVQDYGYSFDNNGNVIGVADNFNPSLSATYGYDTLDQLTSMAPAGQAGLAYTYDAIGNLTGKEGTTQTYGGAGRGPHALATAQGLTYNYDLNGNLLETRDSSNNIPTSIAWNSENMPTTVIQSGITMYQKFFVGESLWKKVEPSGTTYYLPAMRIENGQVRKYFGSFAERSPDNTLKFYHGDHLGSASLVTNSAGAMVTRQAYMPYGSDRSIDPNGSFTPKYQFNFKEKESTGFYDYGARLYNPATGRWLSADSDSTAGLNRYEYASNNPLGYLDPTGHFIVLPSWLGIQQQSSSDQTSPAYTVETATNTGNTFIVSRDWNAFMRLRATGAVPGNLDTMEVDAPPTIVPHYDNVAVAVGGCICAFTDTYDKFSNSVLGERGTNQQVLDDARASNPGLFHLVKALTSVALSFGVANAVSASSELTTIGEIVPNAYIPGTAPGTLVIGKLPIKTGPGEFTLNWPNLGSEEANRQFNRYLLLRVKELGHPIRIQGGPDTGYFKMEIRELMKH